MSTTKNLKNIFKKLVDAYDNNDDAEQESLTKSIKNSGKQLRVVFDDDIQWEESQVEGYKEFPIVIQLIEVFLGDALVYKCERWFGSEKVDSGHTGLGGRWETIRVDEGGDGGIFELLENFGLSVDDPDVPGWK